MPIKYKRCFEKGAAIFVAKSLGFDCIQKLEGWTKYLSDDDEVKTEL